MKSETYPVLVRKQVDPLISNTWKSPKYILLKSAFVKCWRAGAARGPCKQKLPSRLLNIITKKEIIERCCSESSSSLDEKCCCQIINRATRHDKFRLIISIRMHYFSTSYVCFFYLKLEKQKEKTERQNMRQQNAN